MGPTGALPTRDIASGQSEAQHSPAPCVRVTPKSSVLPKAHETRRRTLSLWGDRKFQIEVSPPSSVVPKTHSLLRRKRRCCGVPGRFLACDQVTPTVPSATRCKECFVRTHPARCTIKHTYPSRTRQHIKPRKVAVGTRTGGTNNDAQGHPDDHCAGDHGVSVQPDDNRADNVHGAEEQHIDQVTRPRHQV